MARRTRTTKRSEILARSVIVASTSTAVSLDSQQRRHEGPTVEGRPWLEVRGTTDKPVRDVSDIVISLWPDAKEASGTSRSEWIGAVIGLRPELSLAIGMPPAAFAYVWAMALSGQLKYAFCTFTKPRYRSALVKSLSVSSKPESDEPEEPRVSCPQNAAASVTSAPS